MNQIIKKKILVIEDEPAYQHTLAEKLGMEGFVVLGAKNGEEGLVMALREHPDLILLDIIMPKMDGITMLSKLREDEWGKDVKVVIFSNLAEMGKVASDLKDKGVYKYIVKTDIKLGDLVQKIREFMN